MTTRTTIALGAVFAALLALFIFTGRRERAIERAEFESKKLFSFAAADIQTISIQQGSGEAIEAVRRASGGWEFTGQHRPIPANGALWDQLAEVMTLATNERPIEGGETDLASFALEPPLLSVVLGTKQGVAHQIDFGGLDPTQRHRYLRTADAGVFLSNADLFSIMNRSLAELRDRRLFHNLSSGLVKFEYQRYMVAAEMQEPVSDDVQQRMAGIDDAYERNDAGEWRMVRPVEARARQEQLQALERVLPTLGGRAFIDAPEDLSDYGLDQPFARMTVYGPEGESETLLLGGIDGAQTADGEAGLYVKHDDGTAVIVVDARLFNLLPGEPAAFRERRLFTGEAAHVKTIRYADASYRIELGRTEERWRLVEPATDETDQIAVSMYIAQLKGIQGRTFPENVTAETFGTPRVTLEFAFDDGRAASRIEVGVPVDGSDPLMFYARQDFGPVTVISFDDFQALQVTPFDFHEKALLSFDPKTAERVDATIEGARYVFVRTEGRWDVVEPQGNRVIAQADVNQFVEALAGLHARGVAVPVPAAEIHGLATPVLRVTVRAAGGDLGPVNVGNLKTESSRDRFAGVAGRTLTYFVDQGLIDSARACAAAVRPNNSQ